MPEDVPTRDPLALMADIRHGMNSAGTIGYIGPMPPVGHGIHHYHFQLFALDAPLRFFGYPDRKDLITAMSWHVLGIGDLVGTYERK